MKTCTCEFISLEYVMPGWGCCKCRVYNGMQRKVCKSCGHRHRKIDLPPGIVRHSCGFAWAAGSEPTVCPSCGVAVKPC